MTERRSNFLHDLGSSVSRFFGNGTLSFELFFLISHISNLNIRNGTERDTRHVRLITRN